MIEVVDASNGALPPVGIDEADIILTKIFVSLESEDLLPTEAVFMLVMLSSHIGTILKVDSISMMEELLEFRSSPDNPHRESPSPRHRIDPDEFPIEKVPSTMEGIRDIFVEHNIHLSSQVFLLLQASNAVANGHNLDLDGLLHHVIGKSRGVHAHD